MKPAGEIEEEDGTIIQDLTGSQGELEIDGQLDINRQGELKALVTEFHDIFREVPGEAKGV